MTAVLTHRRALRASRKDLAEIKSEVRTIKWITGTRGRYQILG